MIFSLSDSETLTNHELKRNGENLRLYQDTPVFVSGSYVKDPQQAATHFQIPSNNLGEESSTVFTGVITDFKY